MSVAGANPSVLNVTAGSLDAVAVGEGWPETSLAESLVPSPSPSWPYWFHPQQYAVPPATRPQV